MVEFTFKSNKLGNLRVRINRTQGVWAASTVVGRLVTHLLSNEEVMMIDLAAEAMTGRDDLMPFMGSDNRRAA